MEDRPKPEPMLPKLHLDNAVYTRVEGRVRELRKRSLGGKLRCGLCSGSVEPLVERVTRHCLGHLGQPLFRCSLCRRRLRKLSSHFANHHPQPKHPLSPTFATNTKTAFFRSLLPAFQSLHSFSSLFTILHDLPQLACMYYRKLLGTINPKDGTELKRKQLTLDVRSRLFLWLLEIVYDLPCELEGSDERCLLDFVGGAGAESLLQVGQLGEEEDLGLHGNLEAGAGSCGALG